MKKFLKNSSISNKLEKMSRNSLVSSVSAQNKIQKAFLRAISSQQITAKYSESE